MLQRQKPWPPDGSEVYIGAAAGLALGLYMINAGMPFWSYIGAGLCAFFACIVGVQNWTEDDRQYWRGRKIADQIETSLTVLEEQLRFVKNPTAKKNIADGVENAREIIKELAKKKSTLWYGGLVELQFRVGEMARLDEYNDIIKFPRKAGDKFLEIVQKAEESFAGFSDVTEQMLVRVNKDDIFELTVNAEMLRSFKNIWKRSPKE